MVGFAPRARLPYLTRGEAGFGSRRLRSVRFRRRFARHESVHRARFADAPVNLHPREEVWLSHTDRAANFSFATGGSVIPFEDAYDLVLGAARPLSAETVPLPNALFRVLAEDVQADTDMPPFDRSVVDGYACRRADLGHWLKVIDTVPAGYLPKIPVDQNECAKIMTGAVIPQGADCVFLVEQSETDAEGNVRFTGTDTPDHIVRAGTDFRRGDVLLKTGHRILPPDVAVLASAGYEEIRAYCRPSVGVVATGDELVEPRVKPAAGQIRNSNAYQLCAQIEAMGAQAAYLGIARDNERSLNEFIVRGVMNHHVLIFSGGVSMGDFDLVPRILREHGMRIVFDKIALQPGKPTVFAHSDSVWCFGLPGNPVSTFATFELLVKPFLFALMGHEYRPPLVRMPLERTVTRKAANRKSWVPVVLTPKGTVEQLEYHGSAHIHALSRADGLMAFDIGVHELVKGTVVLVRLVRN